VPFACRVIDADLTAFEAPLALTPITPVGQSLSTDVPSQRVRMLRIGYKTEDFFSVSGKSLIRRARYIVQKIAVEIREILAPCEFRSCHSGILGMPSLDLS
jgi:hypothetical protein